MYVYTYEGFVIETEWRCSAGDLDTCTLTSTLCVLWCSLMIFYFKSRLVWHFFGNPAGHGKIAMNHVIGTGQEKVSVGVGGTGNCNDIHIVTCKYLRELFSHYSHSCLLRSQNSGHLIIPRISKSTAVGRSFSCLASNLWNNLPNTV